MIFSQFNFDGCLSYVIGCDKELVGAVIDPSNDIDVFTNYARKKHLKILYVIDTHSHSDHLSSVEELAAKFKAKTVMNSFFIKQRMVNINFDEIFGLGDILKRNSKIPIDIHLSEGDKLKIGSLLLKVIHTPGHTMDSMSLLGKDRIFTGDTLMAGQCGRTDLPGGSSEDLSDSIFNKLLKLPDNILVYPSHDFGRSSVTTIGHERKNNSFIKSMAVLQQLKAAGKTRELKRENQSITKIV